MRPQRGQALLELALCAPVILALALGAVSAVRVLDAQSGLKAATDAAVSSAVRAPNEDAAIEAAHASFAAIVAAYPLRNAAIDITMPSFTRGSQLNAQSSAFVELPTGLLALSANAAGVIETYRSRP